MRRGAGGHRPAAREAAILSTCNRTEVYVSADEKPDELARWLADYHRLAPGDLQPYLYTLPHEQAVRHAFRVASGLDSMVIGEPQILGQMKRRRAAADQPARWVASCTACSSARSRWRRRCARPRASAQASVSMAAAAVKLNASSRA